MPHDRRKKVFRRRFSSRKKVFRLKVFLFSEGFFFFNEESFPRKVCRRKKVFRWIKGFLLKRIFRRKTDFGMKKCSEGIRISSEERSS